MSLNNILKKLDKASKIEETKLSTHKVDLALADEIKTALGQYKPLDEASKKQLQAVKNIMIKYSDSIRAAYQNAQKSVSLIDELEKKAKELGLPETGYGGYRKEMAQKAKDYQTKFNQIDNIYKSIV